jgi:hypothetical protein
MSAVRRWTAPIALAASVLAMVIAIVAVAIASSAIDQARDATQAVNTAQGSATANPGGGNPTAVPESTGPVVDPTAGPDAEPNATGEPRLDERTSYTSKYEKEVLTLSAERCSNSMYADVDEPRGNVASQGADLSFVGGCSATEPPAFRLGEDVDGSTAGTRESTPADCAEKIRQAPIAEGATIPVRKGIVICLSTSYAAAKARGDQWRIVRLEVTGVANDGTVTVEAYAWNIT